MIRDDHRALCILNMAIAAHDADVDSEAEPVSWEDEIEGVRAFWIKVETAAFDALPAAGVRVVPVEATEEMIEATARAVYAVIPNGGEENRLTTATSQSGRAVYERVFVEDTWEEAPDRHDKCREIARAAIAAMSAGDLINPPEKKP